jgi:hypothetical protein
MTSPRTITEKLLRWTVEEVHHELWLARMECEVFVPHIGRPVCRKHQPNTESCRDAISAVIATKLEAVLGTED